MVSGRQQANNVTERETKMQGKKDIMSDRPGSSEGYEQEKPHAGKKHEETMENRPTSSIVKNRKVRKQGRRVLVSGFFRSGRTTLLVET